jgi:hypothetical protein
LEYPTTKTDTGITVRIYTTKAGGTQPIHGAYQYDGDTWMICAWFADGRKTHLGVSALDLTKAVEKKEVVI